MTPLLQKLFDEIKHGDEEHQEWLRLKLEDFSKRITSTDEPESTLLPSVKEYLKGWDVEMENLDQLLERYVQMRMNEALLIPRVHYTLALGSINSRDKDREILQSRLCKSCFENLEHVYKDK